ncbi:terpenoid cyclases/Protein prenyltransferase [Calocera viscosa TUFC12733]|uniref:Terpenoid cyclases/Protein prenyltransferase n=1 Tax=Calocera viscosa (strain TUFC12733) TaxID=1330018 RepID=A0A167KH76_CALVF|nr:terpenoid cyclases/Protein prenyltransferase [Calocera viscosa TUFC12733]
MRFSTPSGGFAGGPYQNPHLLPTYAAVCALAIVGKPGEEGGWEQIDRVKLYDFFLSLKQPDGSFVVCQDGEVDMRGCYCLLCVATLLDILTPELVEGLAEYIASCQTYEGGFASACYYLPSGARGRLGEAHGGYTYCALASLFLLRPLVPGVFGLIDLPRLVRWATGMQGLEIEGEGFRGRTNKLVDGCYAWWVGGMEPLLRELVREQQRTGKGEEEWEEWDDAVFNQEGIQHYTLSIAQVAQGGLRDKPGKPPDAYHTACNLAGLATAQHRVVRSGEVRTVMRGKWRVAGNPQLEDREGRREAYLASCEWAEDEGAEVYLGGEENRVNAVHPLYNLTITSVRQMMGHFYGQEPVKSSVGPDE